MGYQVGVDIGSAHIVVAISEDNWPKVFSLGAGMQAPAVVYASPDGELHFGRAAQRRAASDPGRAARGFLRRLGDPTPLLLGGSAYTCEALIARTVSWVVATVTRLRQEAPDQVAVTRPTFWPDYRRMLFADAVARAAGVDVPITVCSAADAIAALLTRRGNAQPGTFVGFYDLGAGSFDAAVLAAMPDGFRLAGLAAGINHAGGNDFDDVLLAHILRTVGAGANDFDRADPAVLAALGALRAECNQATKILSEEDVVDISVVLPGLTGSVHVTREEFEALIRPTVDDTIRAFEQALRSVPAVPADLSALLLHGGSAQIPLIDRALATALPDLPRREVGSGVDIALGAALVAAAAAPVASPVLTAIIAPPAPLTAPPAPSNTPPVPPTGPSLPPHLAPGSVTPSGTVPGVRAGGLEAEATARVGSPLAAPGPVGPPGPDDPTIRPTADPAPRRAALSRRMIAAAAALVVVAGAGTVIGLVATSGSSDPTALPAPSVTATEQDPQVEPEPPVNTQNVVRAASSEAVAPILETAYNEFRAQQSGVTVRIEPTSTDDAFARLCRGEVDVAGASFPLNAGFLGDPGCEERVAVFEVAHHTIPIIVNPENTWIRCLTREQASTIWKNGSTITRWNQIDPKFPNEPVTFFGPPAASVHAKVFNTDINGASDNHRDYREVDLDTVAQNVAENRNSIGFLDFANYETAGNRIRGVDLNNGKGCTPPTAITAGTGAYTPLCKPLWVYASKDALRKPGTAAFINFYLPKAQDIAYKAHYVPRSDTTTRQNVDLARKLTDGVEPVRA